MTEDSRGIFTADMAANLLAAFLLILALLPYAETPAVERVSAVPMTVVSGPAFVDALHRRAVDGAERGPAVEIREDRDLAIACARAEASGQAVLLVLDAELLPTVARSGCRALAGARILIVPASLKGADGDWSSAVRRLFAAPDTPETFRRGLLALLQGGPPGGSPDSESSTGMLATLGRLGDDLRRWGDFITAAVMLIFLATRVGTARERGSS